jgi:glycosyltransferase involved in cell wall biosynthesis
MKNILFIHQSAEMYGSDKTLLLLIRHINRERFCPVVILPNEGPLKKALELENIEVYIAPVIKLHRKMFTPKNMVSLLKQIKQAFRIVNKINENYNFEIVYSNTLAVLLGYLFAKKNRIKHVWHVHEIIESPKIVAKTFRFLLHTKSNFFTIYNSNATADFWKSSSRKNIDYEVITNGLEVPSSPLLVNEIVSIRKEIFDVNNEIVIGLVGRINKWKGQFILLEAFSKLIKKYPDLRLIFVGSTTENQSYILKELTAKIDAFQIVNQVKIVPFQPDINKIWSAIDIAIVPSVEPEPFGLVAVEAMLAKKPVIASNHGGLTEIVIHEHTGFLVQPNNVTDLVNAIETLVNDEAKRLEMGEKGYVRAVEEFSIYKYVSNIEKILA